MQTLSYNNKKNNILVGIECGLVTAFIPSSVLSRYQLVSFTIALVIQPPCHIQILRLAANVPSAHPPPPLTHLGGLIRDREMQRSCPFSDGPSLVVQAMFSWHPGATLSSGIVAWDSREETCSECQYRRGKKNAHSRFKSHLLQGMFPLAESPEPAQMIQNILLN